ncbi:tannase/feruloyl esterase family alpha/beta hydrolase [Bradyrhizobium sp. USDA 4353]
MTIRMSALAALLLTTSAMTTAQAEDFKANCAALAQGFSGSGRVVTAEFVAAGGVQLASPAPAGVTSPAPDHCLIRGKINERTGIDGKPYAIGYELRLPATWNGKFVFQGGGGVDGVRRPALGLLTGATPPNALSNGYAAASTDSGHLEEPGPLGPYLFGLDPQARRDKGYSSIPPVVAAAQAATAKLYGNAPRRSYFAGCSNGGRQAMAVTQRFPELFDGVIAGAPAYRVPLAGIDVIAQEQMLLAIAPPGPDGKADVGSALTDEDLKLVADGVAAACDGADGAKDGMVQDVMACRFDPSVLACKEGESAQCLSAPKLKAIKLMFDGSRNAMGGLIYSRWPHDPGLAAPGWRAWKLGTPKVSPPNARNLTLIAGGVPYDFMSPPETPTDLVAWVRNFDIDRDVSKVMKGAGGFDAGMEYEAATSTDLDTFKGKGGKMLFYHGTADPIFSALDTVDYVDQLKKKYPDTDGFARLFLVPGMNHCGGGPATDQFDLLTALDNWVEGKAAAPETIRAAARAAPDVPWPGRTRDLCAFPKVQTYKGSGSLEDAANFECR